MPLANTATVGVAESVCKISVVSDPLPGMSDQQLEAIHSSRRCSNEQGLLDSTSVHVAIVHTQGLRRLEVQPLSLMLT